MSTSKTSLWFGAFALTLAAVPTPNGVRSWTTHGPSDTTVSQILVDPSEPNNLYVVVNGQLYRSSNTGARWSRMSSLFGISSIAALPSNWTTLFAIRNDGARGVVVSTNGGETWTPKGAEVLGFPRQIVIDPRDSHAIYALGSTLWRSSDQGETWNALALPANAIPSAIAVGSDHTLFSVVTVPRATKLLRSQDRGDTWIEVETFFFAPEQLIADPTNSSVLYAPTKSGLARTEDGGAWWEIRGVGEPLAVAISSTDSSVLYAGGKGGIWKSVDAGLDWLRVSGGPAFPATVVVNVLALDPRNNDVVYAGTPWHGLIKSTDGGKSWFPSEQGIQGATVSALAVDVLEPGTLYAGIIGRTIGGDAAIFKSTDSGSSWSELAFGLQTVTALAVSPTAPQYLYAGTGWSVPRAGFFGGEVYRSADSGASWTLMSRLGFVGGLAIDPLDHDTIYASYSGRLARSTDGGREWREVAGGLPAGGAQILFDPKRSDTIYAATSSGVFKSIDHGRTWTGTSAGLPSPNVTALALTSTSQLYAGTDVGVFRSNDGGASWIATALTTRTDHLEVNPKNPANLFAAAYGVGVFESQDAGRSWSSIGDGLPSLYFTHFALDTSGTLHVPLSGVWDRSIRGLTRTLPARP